MTATTHPEFHADTEALEVAKAFHDSVKGKTILITGVNLKGIGFATAQAFASQGPRLIIVAGRTESKLQESVDALKKEYPNVEYRILLLNLSTQKTARAAAEQVLAWKDVPTIDLLINSAGLNGVHERTLNEDGIELIFATNHIGHFLFSNLIMPKMIKAAENNPAGATRIVNVSSGAAEANGIRWSDINFDKKSRDLSEAEQPGYPLLKAWGITDAEDLSYIRIEAYIQSKAANVLYSIGLTKRLYEKHGILSVGLHPGVIKTEFGRDSTKEDQEAIANMERQGFFKYRTLGAGASTTLVAALDPALGPSEIKDGKEGYGAYLKDCQISDRAHPRAVSGAEAEKLWTLSEELVKEKFSW